MTKIDTMRLGAHVFERIALADQILFTTTVKTGQGLPDSLLAAIGRVDRGQEFLTLFGLTINEGELIDILSHVDRFTESRLIETLENIDPGQADWLKQQFFVFEDLILCDPEVTRLLFQEIDRDIWQVALLGADQNLREKLLSAIPATDAVRFQSGLAAADGQHHRVRLAQEAVVESLKQMDLAGRVKVVRPSESAQGWPEIRLA